MKWWRENRGETPPFSGQARDMKNMLPLLLTALSKEEHALKIRWVKAPLNGRRNVQNNSNAPQGNF